MYRTERGFTLVELMVVVTVVAVLAAIAIPTYQAYTVRSRISEALAMMGACKTAVTDYLASKAALPPDLDAAGCADYAGTQYVAGIDVVDGTITMTMATSSRLGAASGGSVKLTPSLSASNMISAWTCAPGDSSPVPETLLPGVCR